MARVSLRAYNQEIEGLIESHQIDQAIAHCQHIIHYYPKHIDTYRLLGKTYLESRSYGDAADIFQRVLSSIPDDFVSHVGMSIIREDEGNLEEAIWYMERAFDVQPANSAIQRELSRLYGGRDGLEPPKIRLTRGALARMYFKGELYPQAITEIRAVLTNSPRRFDLLVLLANAHFHAGQRFEAAEVCSRILKALPFCLDANYILGEILADSERAAEAKTFQLRAQALNPYLAHINPNAPSPEKVSDSAVVIEKLIWTPGKATQQPAWAASLGVDLEDTNAKDEPLLEWLAETEDASDELQQEKVISSSTSSLDEEFIMGTPSQPQSEEKLPEWMQAAGWEPGSGAADEVDSPETELDSDLSEEELAPAEMPDWMREIAPDEDLEEVDFLAEEIAPSDSDSSKPKSTGSLPWIEDAPASESDSVATWLQDKKVSVTGDLNVDQPEESAELPEWLQGMDEIPAQEEISQALSGIDEDLTPQADYLAEEPRELSVEHSATINLPESESEESSDLDGDEALAWLEGLAVKQGVKDGLLSSPEDRRETLPEWAEEMPDWPSLSDEQGEVASVGESTSEMEPTSDVPLTPDEEEAFAWLEGLAVKQGADEAIFSHPEDRPEGSPQWVQEAVSDADLDSKDQEEESVVQQEVEGFDSTPSVKKILAASLLAERHFEEEGDFPEDKAEIPADEFTETRQETETVDAEKASQPSDDTIPPLPEWLKSEYVEPTLEYNQTEDDLPKWLETASTETESEPIEELTSADATVAEEGQLEAESVDFEMLFGPGEIQLPAEHLEPLEQLIIEEPPIIEGDTSPTGIRSEADEYTPSRAEQFDADQDIPEWLEGLEDEADLASQLDIGEELQSQPEMEVSADEAAAFTWLEGLAAEQGADEALLLQPEERIDEPPDWVVQASEEDTEPVLIGSQTEEIQVSAELATEAIQTSEAVPELPGWLAGLEQESAVIEESEWQPTEEIHVEDTPAQQAEPAAEKPSLNINEAGLVDFEQLPGIGFIKAQAILEYREEHGDFNQIDDLLNVAGLGPSIIDNIRNLITVGAPLEIETLEPLSDHQITLLKARNAFVSGEIDETVALYAQLIKSEELLPDVINDLNEALYRYPVEVPLWEALGDAYFRVDKLQDALDAYIKAEELLR